MGSGVDRNPLASEDCCAGLCIFRFSSIGLLLICFVSFSIFRGGGKFPCFIIHTNSCLLLSLIGLYFSAHWCPPCRGFTPTLIEFYKTMQANNQGLEVIYVSLDRNRASFDEYYGTMPWYTIPYEDDARVSRTDSAISNWTTNSWLLGKISFEELTWLNWPFLV